MDSVPSVIFRTVPCAMDSTHAFSAVIQPYSPMLSPLATIVKIPTVKLVQETTYARLAQIAVTLQAT